MKLYLIVCALISSMIFQLNADSFVRRTVKYPFRVTRDVGQDTVEVFTGNETKRVAVKSCSSCGY